MTTEQLATLALPVIARCRRELPPELQPLAASVPVHFPARPDAELLASGYEPDLLGLFVGAEHGEDPGSHPLPPQILLYVRNLWEHAEQDREIFCEEVEITYLHELGHYLGWDEDDLAARDLD